MKIRWNTTYAEVLRGIDLKPVSLLYHVQHSYLRYFTGHQSVDRLNGPAANGKEEGGGKTSTKEVEIDTR
jgi:hypothetical protein